VRDAPERIRALAEQGVREVAIELFGARAAVHEWHTKTEGSFEAVVRALELARSHGLSTVVRTEITRSNVHVLAELPPLLRARGVSLWIVSFGSGPRVGIAAPHALAAIDRATKIGLPARALGLPLCALGTFAEHALVTEPRSYAAPCERCAARSQCPGVDGRYLERFGSGELRPRELVALRPAPAIVRASLLER
jgi:hypothetical protein